MSGRPSAVSESFADGASPSSCDIRRLRRQCMTAPLRCQKVSPTSLGRPAAMVESCVEAPAHLIAVSESFADGASPSNCGVRRLRRQCLVAALRCREVPPTAPGRPAALSESFVEAPAHPLAASESFADDASPSNCAVRRFRRRCLAAALRCQKVSPTAPAHPLVMTESLAVSESFADVARPPSCASRKPRRNAGPPPSGVRKLRQRRLAA